MKEKNYEQDPSMTGNETGQSNTQGSDPYGFAESMKDMPSYSEHMEQMKEEEEEEMSM